MLSNAYVDGNYVVAVINENNNRDSANGRWGSITLYGKDANSNTYVDQMAIYQPSPYITFTDTPGWGYNEYGLGASKFIGVESEMPYTYQVGDPDNAFSVVDVGPGGLRAYPLQSNSGSTAPHYLSVLVSNGFNDASITLSQSGYTS